MAERARFGKGRLNMRLVGGMVDLGLFCLLRFKLLTKTHEKYSETEETLGTDGIMARKS
jgi:hypothetical protein